MPRGEVYLFLGPEIGEKEDAVNAIRRKYNCPEKQGGAFPAAGDSAEKAAPGGGEETVYYAGETPVQAIAGVLQNGSLFAEKRLFIIKNAEAFSAKKPDDMKLLASCLESPQDETAVILLSDETSVSKTLEKAVPPANKRIFWELDEARKTEWVANFFRRGGARISPGGIETVLELVENNTASLRRECGALLFFLKDRERVIDEEAVEQWLSHSREESAFTLFARIARGELSKSLESLRTMLAAKESPQGILAGLAWCFRKLRDYLVLKNSGQANDFEYRKIGLASQKVRKDYIEAGRRFASAEPSLALIADYDIRLRSSGGLWEGFLMDNLVCALLGNDKR